MWSMLGISRISLIPDQTETFDTPWTTYQSVETKLLLLTFNDNRCLLPGPPLSPGADLGAPGPAPAST